MSKHTPGPWVWGDWTILGEDRPAQKRGEPYWTLIEGDEVLCQGPIGRKAMDTTSIVWPVGYETEGIGANDSDMALIAAAPDLLEALRQCKHGAEYPDELGDIIDAAIAKAEGRADGGEQGLRPSSDGAHHD